MHNKDQLSDLPSLWLLAGNSGYFDYILISRLLSNSSGFFKLWTREFSFQSAVYNCCCNGHFADANQINVAESFGEVHCHLFAALHTACIE